MSAPTAETIALLVARSGNSCAAPDCSAPVVVEAAGQAYLACQVVPIRVTDPALPRFDAALEAGFAVDAANLILLCAWHRRAVATDPATYTADTLTKWEAEKAAANDPDLNPSLRAADRLTFQRAFNRAFNGLTELELPLSPLLAATPKRINGPLSPDRSTVGPTASQVADPTTAATDPLLALDLWAQADDEFAALVLRGPATQTWPLAAACAAGLEPIGWLSGSWRRDTAQPALALAEQRSDLLIVVDHWLADLHATAELIDQLRQAVNSGTDLQRRRYRWLFLADGETKPWHGGAFDNSNLWAERLLAAAPEIRLTVCSSPSDDDASAGQAAGQSAGQSDLNSVAEANDALAALVDSIPALITAELAGQAAAADSLEAAVAVVKAAAPAATTGLALAEPELGPAGRRLAVALARAALAATEGDTEASANARANLAACLLSAGQAREALKQAEMALKQLPNPTEGDLASAGRTIGTLITAGRARIEAGPAGQRTSRPQRSSGRGSDQAGELRRALKLIDSLPPAAQAALAGLRAEALLGQMALEQGPTESLGLAEKMVRARRQALKQAIADATDSATDQSTSDAEQPDLPLPTAAPQTNLATIALAEALSARAEASRLARKPSRDALRDATEAVDLLSQATNSPRASRALGTAAVLAGNLERAVRDYPAADRHLKTAVAAWQRVAKLGLPDQLGLLTALVAATGGRHRHDQLLQAVRAVLDCAPLRQLKVTELADLSILIRTLGIHPDLEQLPMRSVAERLTGLGQAVLERYQASGGIRADLARRKLRDDLAKVPRLTAAAIQTALTAAQADLADRAELARLIGAVWAAIDQLARFGMTPVELNRLDDLVSAVSDSLATDPPPIEPGRRREYMVVLSNLAGWLGQAGMGFSYDQASLRLDQAWAAHQADGGSDKDAGALLTDPEQAGGQVRARALKLLREPGAAPAKTRPSGGSQRRSGRKQSNRH